MAQLKCILFMMFLSLSAQAIHPQPTSAQIKFYRTLVSKVRPTASFKVPLPNGNDMVVDYSIKLDKPVIAVPVISDIHFGENNEIYSRNFWDRIYTKEGSHLNIGGEQIPITCVFFRGQDNRGMNNPSPLLPQFLMEVYIVADDYTCTGPINPGWPDNGGKRETWETYIYYRIKDPTIMQPMEVQLRYRWNNYQVVLIK